MSQPNLKLDIYADKIANEYALAPRQHTKYDTHYNTENEYCTVLANHRDGSNCLVKFNPLDFA